ncbi:MAG: NUDIX domain-containing protein [bacterium]|nr:NUDIX domain-containing protein [bacterium]
MRENKIRPVALLVAMKNNKILVIAGYDYHKKENFYRLIGGGIEFGETGKEALKREVKEEIKAEIKNVKYLGLIENLFNYEGKGMHEIILVYKAEFKDKNIYKKEEMKILDSRHPQKAYWLNKKAVLKEKFYPEELRKLI